MSEKEKKKIKYHVDSLSAVNDRFTVTGWAYDEDSLKIPKIELQEANNPFIGLNDREDVTDSFDLEFPSPLLGFNASFDYVEDEEMPKLVLTDSNGEELEIEFTPEDFTEVKDEMSWKKMLHFMKRFGLKEGPYYVLKMNQENWLDYQTWLEHMESTKDVEAIKEEIKHFKKKPKISIVMPVYNIELRILKEAIDSVIDQVYENWELCIADDNSSQKSIKPLLEKYAKQDDRIKVVYRTENGHISEATNSALELATGEYIAFMDDDDILTPFALYENVKIINENKNVDLIYSDEDFINEYSFAFDPHFKSNWNPRLFFSHNYLTHFIVVKRSIVDKVGGLRTKTNGAQDYDFLIRVFDYANDVFHIPEILYHWRSIEGSVAKNPEAKTYAYEAGRVALQDYLDKNEIPAEAEIGQYYGTYEIHRTDEPKVSIITVFDDRDRALSLKTLTDIIANTDYDNYEVIAVNYDPVEMTQFVSEEDLEEKVKFVKNTRPISIDEMYYHEGLKADGDYICTVKVGISPSTQNWLSELVDQMIFDFNGMSTPVVADKDLRMISAGFYYDDKSRSLFFPGSRLPAGDLGFGFRTSLSQNVEANLDECYLVSKEDFKHLKPDGFVGALRGLSNAKRIEELGKRVAFNPNAVVIWNGTLKGRDGITTTTIEEKYHQKKLPKDIKDHILLDLTLTDLENYKYLTGPNRLENDYVHELIKKQRRAQDHNYTGLSGDSNVWKP